MKKAAPIKVGDYSFTVLIEPNDPDGYLVTCPALPGLVTEGDTLDEAFAMAKDAIAGYLTSLINMAIRSPKTRWRFRFV